MRSGKSSIENKKGKKGEDFAQIPDPLREDEKKGEMILTGPDERVLAKPDSCSRREC